MKTTLTAGMIYNINIIDFNQQLSNNYLLKAQRLFRKEVHHKLMVMEMGGVLN